MKEPRDPADPTQQHPEQARACRGRGTTDWAPRSHLSPETKLSPGSSLNDHTGSYTFFWPGGGAASQQRRGGAGDRPDTDELTGRRDDTSLQGTATTAAATKEAGGGGGVAMGAVLPQLIDAAASASNLAFLAATEAAAAP
ncbi:uncharacterized protein BDCG_00272 [Blastomyces dermatitidis ER-3]|uniref:Uncharacterized protein n=1 Tax=Ajellomyces dermatitidis (strain ER-3 / ATCC MYA-2586) TaxID=559297 RepID=A0ABM9YF63_AJEDR|nr:uncharacterized protein BDCG_00272 [Blastomyces dermatitidis ER-3]EEQ83467.2 hypothetical protein BDCG_00272 [Blastomyces dermatitidis ER-3]